jgi:LysR family glycine cleavage system transcriptional activator
MLKKRRLPPLNSLRAFEAAARQGSIARAAEELGVTAGAVSHQIKTLESYTGIDLLERSGNSFRLTAAGIQLMGPLQSGLDLFTDAVAGLDRPEVHGDVVVACPPALTVLWLVRRVHCLLLNYKGIRLSLRPSLNRKDVIGSDVDLCIRYGDPIWPGRRATLLSEVYLFPVCSAEVATKLQFHEDLKDLPALCPDSSDEWDLWLSTVVGQDLPGIRHFMGSSLAMVETAKTGLGVAMGDNITCKSYLESGELVAPFSERVRSPLSFYLIESGDEKKRSAVNMVREWILEEFASMR